MLSLIQAVLSPNTELIRAATVELEEACKHPYNLVELYQIVSNADNSEGERKLAVNLLSKAFKSRGWYKAPDELQQHIKSTIAQVILDASCINMHKQIAQLLASVLKYEESDWRTELMQSLFQTCAADPSEQLQEVAAATIDVLADQVPELIMQDCLSGFFETTDAILVKYESMNQWNSPIIVSLMEAMSRLVVKLVAEDADDASWSPAERKYERYIPTFIKALAALATLPEEEPFMTSFNVLDNLEVFDKKLLLPHIAKLLEFSLLIGANPSYQLHVRVRCIAFINSLLQTKSVALANLQLLERVAPLIFNIISMETVDDDIESADVINKNDVIHPVNAATSVLYTLAETISTPRLLQLLAETFSTALASENVHARRAAFTSIGIIAEAAREEFPADYLDNLIEHIKSGLLDVSLVRKWAFFALEQLIEQVQLQINKYVDSIMPILLQNLQQLCAHLSQSQEVPLHIKCMFDAIESVCLRLDSALEPYLPALMEMLLPAIHHDILQAYALKVLSGCVQSNGSQMLPYVDALMQTLGQILSPDNKKQSEESLPAAIDTLAELARYIDKNKFASYLESSLSFGLQMLSQYKENSNIKGSLYNLFAALATVLGDGMGNHLPSIVDSILLSFMNESEADLSFDIPTDVDSITSDFVENVEQQMEHEEAYFEEGVDAVRALKAFAENCGTKFLPYVQKCIPQMLDLFELSNTELLQATAQALAAFVLLLQKHKAKTQIHKCVPKIVRRFTDSIMEDDDHKVVLEVVKALADVLRSMKALKSESLRLVINKCFMKTLSGKLACFAEENMDESNLADSIAVFEGVLAVVPAFGNTMDSSDFKMFVSKLKPLLLAKLTRCKKANKQRISQIACVLSTFGKIFVALKSLAAEHFESLIGLFIGFMSDAAPNIRRYAAYAMSQLVLNSGAIAHGHFANILNTIKTVLENETDCPAKVSQVLALARVMIASPQNAELDISVPLLMQYLPILEDLCENEPVLKCFGMLYAEYPTAMEPFTEQVLDVVMRILMEMPSTVEEDQEAKDRCINLLKNINYAQSTMFNAYMQTHTSANEFLLLNYAEFHNSA